MKNIRPELKDAPLQVLLDEGFRKERNKINNLLKKVAKIISEIEARAYDTADERREWNITKANVPLNVVGIMLADNNFEDGRSIITDKTFWDNDLDTGCFDYIIQDMENIKENMYNEQMRQYELQQQIQTKDNVIPIRPLK